MTTPEPTAADIAEQRRHDDNDLTIIRRMHEDHMHNNITRTYFDLMTSLTALPDEIAAAQDELTQAKFHLAKLERNMDDVEAHTALTIEGKNAEERKAKLALAVRSLPEWMADSILADTYRRTVAELTNAVDALTRQFAAVGYQAKLHAAMIAYLANAFPGVPMDLEAPVVPLDVNAAGSITAADAVEFGL